MRNKPAHPADFMELPATGYHRHRASCHGPIGELQCGIPEGFETQVGQIKPPLSMFERVSLMITCYVVMFAALMLIVGIIDLYMFLDSMSKAFENWGNQLDVG